MIGLEDTKRWVQRLKFRLLNFYVNARIKRWTWDSPSIVPSDCVTIVGYFSAASGIGEGARLLRKGLLKAGVDVRAIDATPWMTPHLQKLEAPQDADPGTGLIIFHINPPEISHVLLRMGESKLSGRPRVAFWVWELETAPVSWKNPARYFDQIWSPSGFSAAAISKLGLQTACLRYPFELPLISSLEPADDIFKIIVLADSFSSLTRKNLLQAVEVFQNTFTSGEQVTLTVKLSNALTSSMAGTAQLQNILTLIEGDCRIIQETETLTSEEVSRLISGHNVLLNLHRAEGFGLPIAESLLLGRDVVSTNWSAPAEFTGAEGAHGLDFKLIDIVDPQKIYGHGKWAQPDLVHASETLLSLYKHWQKSSPDARARRRARIRQSANVVFGQDRFASEYRQLSRALFNDI